MCEYQSVEVHEQFLVNEFFQKNKRERFLSFLKSKKKRQKFLDELYHFSFFIEDFLIASSVKNKDFSSRSQIIDFISQKGVPKDCYIISTDFEIDGHFMAFEEAIERIIFDIPSIISLIPGKLIMYQAEGFGGVSIYQK